MKPEIVLLSFSLLAFARANDGLSRQVFRSPDGALVATVTATMQPKYGLGPSRIEIRDRRGHLLAERDHALYPDRGVGVEHAAWAKDSSLFIYSAEEPDGHQPWHHPTFIYSGQKRHFYSLEKVLNTAISGTFELKPPQTMFVEVLKPGRKLQAVQVKDKNDGSGDKILTINLKGLENRFTRDTISSDRLDRRAKLEETRTRLCPKIHK